MKGWEWERVGRHLYATLFYEDPIWISLHNYLHSPTMLLLLLVVLYVTQSRESFVHSWRSWFLGSCLLHTLVDIPVHHDDGPLIFWPFNWTYRFASPISYWDPAHYGVPTMIFEGGLVVCLAAMLIWQRYRSRPRT